MFGQVQGRLWSRDNYPHYFGDALLQTLPCFLILWGLSTLQLWTWTNSSPLWAIGILQPITFQPITFHLTHKQSSTQPRVQGVAALAIWAFPPCRPLISWYSPSQVLVASTSQTVIFVSSTQWDHGTVWFLIPALGPGNSFQAVSWGSPHLFPFSQGSQSWSTCFPVSVTSYLIYFVWCSSYLQQRK